MSSPSLSHATSSTRMASAEMKTHTNRINKISNHVAPPSVPSFSREEILAKREEGQIWIVMKNKVYDVTDFLDEHPGGSELITDIPADDFKQMAQEFDDAEHSEEAMEQLQSLFKGVLRHEIREEEEEEEEEEESVATTTMTASLPFQPFSGHTSAKLLLESKEHLSHDVTVYRFALPNPQDRFSLPIGKHIVLSFEDEENNKKHISRAYTPVSPKGDMGFVDFLIKAYPMGKMSTHLSQLVPGKDSLQMHGPKGKLEYLGQGQFSIRNKTVSLRNVCMIAGGSGITPMFQILQAAAFEKSLPSHVQFTLVFGNKTVEDMILRHPLNAIMQRMPKNIKIVYTLDVRPPAPSSYTGHVGFITKQLLAEHFPLATEPGSMVFLCGPPAMIKKACLPALKDLGFTKEQIFKF